MKNLHLKLINFLILVVCLFVCNKKAETLHDAQLEKATKDSIIKSEKVIFDFDTLVDPFSAANTITFQNRDSNMVYIASIYSIIDIEKVDSTKFNIKVDIGLVHNYQFNLHSKDSTLLENLSNSFSFSHRYLVFKLNPASFRSTTIQDYEGGLTKLIIGDGELLKAIGR